MESSTSRGFLSTESKLFKMSIRDIESPKKVALANMPKNEPSDQLSIKHDFADLIHAVNINLDHVKAGRFDADFHLSSVGKQPSETPCHFSHKAAILKKKLIRVVLNSLVIKNEDIKDLLSEIATIDPEFILKVALYCRQDVNIRDTANECLAFAAYREECRPFLPKYYSSSVQLPTDWLEVVHRFQILNEVNKTSKKLPNALRKAMVKKFLEFDEFKLAKYNRNSAMKRKTPLKFRKSYGIKFVTLKDMIWKLHISQPARSVVSLLGKPYPSDVAEFNHWGLPGDWKPELAGKRMRLPVPYTWETELSSTPRSDQKTAWESLIHANKLPYMAMLRNLRNILLAGVSDVHLNTVVQKLVSPSAVSSSRQMPFRFYSAFESVDSILQIRCPNEKRRRDDRIDNVKQSNVDRLKNALEEAFDLSIRLNLPTIPGSTLIFISYSKDISDIPKKKCTTAMLLGLMCITICEHSDAYIVINELAMNLNDLVPILKTQEEGLLKSVTQWVDKLEISVRNNELIPQMPFDDLAECLLVAKRKYSSVVAFGDEVKKINEFTQAYEKLVGPTNKVSHDGLATDDIFRLIGELGNENLLRRVETIDERFNLSDASSTLSGSRRPNILVTPDCEVSLELPRSLSGAVRVQVFVSSPFRDMCGERDLISGVVFPALRKQLSHLECPVMLNEIDLRWGVPESSSKSPESIRVCLEQVVSSDYLILLLGERYGWAPSKDVVAALPSRLLSQVMEIYEEGMSITEMEARMFINLNRQSKKKNLLVFIRDPQCLEHVPPAFITHFRSDQPNKRARLDLFKTFLKLNGLVNLNEYPAAYAGNIRGFFMMGDLSTLGEAIFDTLFSLIRQDIASNTPLTLSNCATSPSNVSSTSLPPACLEAIAASASPRHLREVLKALLVDLTARGAQVRRARKAIVDQKARHSAIASRLLVSGSKRKAGEPHDGGLLCLIGSHGSGKTTLVAAVATVLSDPTWTPDPIIKDRPSTAFSGSTASPGRLRARVYVHLTMGATTSASRHSGLILPTAAAIPQMTQLKGLLTTWIGRIMEELRVKSSNSSTEAEHIQRQLQLVEDQLRAVGIVNIERDCDMGKAITIFHQLIRIIGEYVINQYIFIVDSVDHLVPQTLDWIPDVIPENVKFMFSLDGSSNAAQDLSSRPDTLYIRMNELTLDEKSAAIRCYFAQYGKVLSETGFGSQLSKLAKKRDAGLPLYLKMACDELRLYSTFEDLDASLQRLPDRLPGLVSHIVARASVCCGEALVRTALSCLLCARRPLQPSQLKRIITTWLAAPTSDKLVAFFTKGVGEEAAAAAAADGSIAYRFSTLGLHILLAQLQPLLVGFDGVGESQRGRKRKVDEADMEGLFSASGGGLRICGLEVAAVVRQLCFGSSDGVSSVVGRFPAFRRVGYTTSSSRKVSKRTGVTENMPQLTETPSPTQTYLLLLLEHQSNIFDNVFYAFKAKQFSYVQTLLSDLNYIRQKILNNDLSGLIEEYLGFHDSDIKYKDAWNAIVAENEDRPFGLIRQFVLKSGQMLAKYPHLAKQLIRHSAPDNLPEEWRSMLYDDDGPANVGGHAWTIERVNAMSANHLRRPELVWRPKGSLGAPTALNTDGVDLIACGTDSGSVTLLDASSGKEMHSFYGHNGAVTGVVFIQFDSGVAMDRCLLLYSVSADATGCLWKLVSSSSGGGVGGNASSRVITGIKLAQISGQHNRGISACLWNSAQRTLVTAGLDGVVQLYAITPDLGRAIGGVGDGTSVGGLDLNSFKHPHTTLSTHYQPINTMIFIENTIIVGCWDGSIWAFDTKLSTKQMYMPQPPQSGKIGARTSAVTSLAYSGPLQHVVASVDASGAIRILEVATMTCVMQLNMRDTSTLLGRLRGRAVFVQKANGDCLLTAVGSGQTVAGGIAVWNLDQAKRLGGSSRKTPTEISAAAFTNSNELFYGASDGSVFALDGNAEKTIVARGTYGARVQAMCSFGRECSVSDSFVYGTSGGDVNIVEKSKVHTTWSHAIGQQKGGGGEAGGTLAVSAHNAEIVVSGGGDAACCFHIRQNNSWNKEFRICEHNAGVSAVAVDSRFAVSGGKDGHLVIYEVTSLRSSEPFKTIWKETQAHMDWITCLAIASHDDKYTTIVSGGNDHRVSFWRLGNHQNRLQQIWVSSEHAANITNLSVLENYVASASANGVVSVWDCDCILVRRCRRFIVRGESESTRILSCTLNSSLDTPEAIMANISATATPNNIEHGLMGSSIENSELGQLSEDIEIVEHAQNDTQKKLISEANLQLDVVHCDGIADNNGDHLCHTILRPCLPEMELGFLGHTYTSIPLSQGAMGKPDIHLVVHDTGDGARSLVSAGLTNLSLDSVSTEICLWKTDGGSREPTSNRHHSAITAIAEDKGVVATASEDGNVELRRISDGLLICATNYLHSIVGLVLTVSDSGPTTLTAELIVVTNHNYFQIRVKGYDGDCIEYVTGSILQPGAFSVSVIPPGHQNKDVFIATTNGCIHKLLDSCKCQRKSLHSSYEMDYFALVNGVICVSRNGSAFETMPDFPEGPEITGLQVLLTPAGNSTFCLISSTPPAPSLSLLNDLGRSLSWYQLPEGVEVTAFCANDIEAKDVRNLEILVIVGASDGVIRYLQWDLSKPELSPQLMGYFPTGMGITKILVGDPDHFTVGFSNGDVGIYRLRR